MLMAAFSIFVFFLFFSLHVSQTLPIPEPYGSPPPLSTTVALLAPILSSLNYSQLAVAVPFLSSPILSSPWPTPITLFAFSSNSDPQLLKEHLAPGLFTFSYLSDLKFGSKLQTVASDRCLTVTSVAGTNKVFIDGAEIIHPDLYNDGRIVIHGITDVLAPLPSDSCNANNDNVITSLMLKDSVAKLKSVGFGILASAIQFSWLDLVELKNMTVFALDDVSIVNGGGFGYIRDLRFHIVPNRMVRVEELMQVGLAMESMETGRHLIVTGHGMVNFVPVREGEVVVNGRVVVHRLVFPLSRLDLADLAILEDEYFNGDAAASTTNMSALGGM